MLEAHEYFSFAKRHGRFLLETQKEIYSLSLSENPTPLEESFKVQEGQPAQVRAEDSPFVRLSGLLEDYRGKSHLIILQGTPDPDAISAALALEYICSLYEIDTTILCFANVSHQENRALVKRLEIKLVLYSESFDLSSYSMYSIVDSQKFSTPIDGRLEENDVKFLAFIDHHREDINPPPAMFVDVREGVASTAAIVCEYLKQAAPKGLEPSDADHVKLATTLMYGIRTDTRRFALATRAEYEAGMYLAPCVDNKMIDHIERKTLTSSVLGILENALVHRRVHDNFIFSDVGFVRAVDRDGIPQAAELLLAREGTDTVLVYGIVDGKMVDGSFRTRSEIINPDEFLKGVLGVSPENGQYYGGGNIQDRGAFQIPLGFLSLCDDKSQVYSMARAIIEKSFLDYIGKASKEK